MPAKSTRSTSRTIIFVALGANILVAVIKFCAAAWTGSSAMLSEGIHSTVDMGNELLLLYGMHRGERAPDHEHPMGHGREVYFWSFAVALMFFAVGAVAAINQGITSVLHPRSVQNVEASYLVLLISALIDGTSWWIELHLFKGKRRYSQVINAIHRSKDPPSFVVLFEDSASLIGLAIAFLGIYLSSRFNLPVLDGVASILLGLVLAGTAVLLGMETKSLLIGEPADGAIVTSIIGIAETIDGITCVNNVLTVHLAPQQIIAALSIEFDDVLKTPEIEAKITELEHRVRRQHPAVIALFVKPQSPEAYRDMVKRRFDKTRS